MYTFWIILALILIITILIEIMTFVHELGHFMIAKFSKATVVEFAIGFGPAIYQKKVGDTTYSFRVLPFGGYVSVLSDEIVQGLEKLKSMNLTPQQAVSLKKQLKGFDENINWTEKPTIDKVSAPKKVWFACMGVTMNFLMLWAILFVTYASAGKKVDDNTMFITPVIATQWDNGTPKKLDDDFVIFEPIHTASNEKDPKNPIVLSNQTEKTNQISGEVYYEELMNEVNLLSDDSSSPITPLADKNLTLSYNETNDIEDPYSDTADVWTSGTFEFTNLVQFQTAGKTNAEIYYLFPNIGSNPDYVHTYPRKEAVNLNPQGILESAPIWSTIAIPVVEKTSDGIIPYGSNFGVIEDYTRPGFGKSIYMSLEDSFIYLWEGVIELFDLITFGLVLNDPVPYMYANNQHIVTATAGLWWGNMTFVMFVWMSYLMIVFNILPFPPLDGWRVVEYSYEGIKKKKIDSKTTALMFKIGIALFFIVLIGGMIIGI